MIQQLSRNATRFKEPSTMDRLGRALSVGAGAGIEHLQQQQMLAQENEAARRQGIDISGIRDPKMRQQVLAIELQGRKKIELDKAKRQNQLDLMNQLGLGDLGESKQLPTREGNNAEINSETGEMNVRIPTPISQDKINKMAMINPAVADKMQKYNDNLRADQKHQEIMNQREREFQLREKEKSPEYIREKAETLTQAKADIDYNKQLQASSSQHKIKTQTLNKLEKLNEKGVTGKPYEKLLEKFGLVNLTSEGRREFSADVKHLITDIRSILGGQFSNFEFQTILNAYPSADFSQEANRSIIRNLKEFEDIRDKEFEFANQIKKENKGKIPSDFQSLVNDRLNEYVQNRLPDIKANTRKIMHEEYGIQPGFMLMFDPQGEPLNVPEDMIDQYSEMGATLP